MDAAPADEPYAAGNVVFFASDGPLVFTIPVNAVLDDRAAERILRSFENWEVLQNIPRGRIITDERNPLTSLQLPIAEEHFEAMNKLLPPEVWLH
ncbi:MAG: hypothetical protein FWD17_01000 [Polyangiaceae bacterium]|nr:hypothetical protein [Polyangiaceae bacterium]